MNRLRDESAIDPVGERGIRMLRKVEPAPRPPEMKMRVWAALQQAAEKRAPASRLRALGLGSLRKLTLGAGIFAFAATAAGAIGGRWIVRHVEALRGPSAPAVDATAHERPRAVRRVAAAAPPDVQPVAPEAPPPAPRRPPAREVEAPRLHPVAASPARERTQVLDALIALRRDHDPERAQALLDPYLQRSRQGALREEALVLAIEAADARSDRARAARLAQVYQDEYPGGRFAPFVASHIRP
ncbi:MAG TPA: hypothetical protein VHM31_06600 [Polyangia bacterium]|nr:hypothetical protein [Polyangia bacterium]